VREGWRHTTRYAGMRRKRALGSGGTARGCRVRVRTSQRTHHTHCGPLRVHEPLPASQVFTQAQKLVGKDLRNRRR
jgi:hypothetical protein